MEKLYFVIFAILIGANLLIPGVFSDDIDVAKAVKFYNSIPGLSWEAGGNGYGKTLKLSQIKSNLGLILKQKKTQQKDSSHDHDKKEVENDNLPKHYDCRAAFPKCTTISSIKDQSNCGSCWAVAVAAAFSDRLCIHSQGKINFNMSADQLLACDKKSKGCKGGHLDTAWRYIAEQGLVTGGDYGSKEGCRPYSIPPEHSFFAPSPKTPECGNTPCPDKFKAKNETIVPTESKEYVIRKHIYENGPITTGFMVYLSFNFYKKGIYQSLFIDLPMGGHGVRVIGWGEENGTKYWLVANSWGRKWGENGTFRIRRGTNECDFEDNMIAGLPVV